MKLSELMAGITPAPEYEGPVSADDYVLAIGLSGSETGPGDYLVAQEGITEHSGALSAVTNDVTYIRSGPQNVRQAPPAPSTLRATGTRVMRSGCAAGTQNQVRHREDRDQTVCVFLYADRQGRTGPHLHRHRRRPVRRCRQQRGYQGHADRQRHACRIYLFSSESLTGAPATAPLLKCSVGALLPR